MDTAFVSQIGFTRVSSMNSLYFYPPSIPGVRAASFWLWTAGVRDSVAARDGHELNAGVRLSMSPQGSILLKLLSGREPWAGRTYDARGIQVEASSQILPSLSLFSSFLARRAPYYEGQPAFAGNLRDLSVGVVFEPTPRLSHAFDLRRVKFNRQDTNEHVYGVVLVDARTTYQFTSQLAARGIVQYDSSRHRVLLDTLGSYEVRPGTLIYAGYGALAERLMDGNGHSVPGVAHYLTTKRGLFVKASYLCRF